MPPQTSLFAHRALDTAVLEVSAEGSSPQELKHSVEENRSAETVEAKEMATPSEEVMIWNEEDEKQALEGTAITELRALAALVCRRAVRLEQAAARDRRAVWRRYLQQAAEGGS